MKLNISYPSHGTQKTIEIDNELKMRPFYEKRISHEVPGDSLGDEFKGYIFRITGGNDRQGFPMKQGILTNKRVRLLFSKGQSCYRSRRAGERKRKSVRGCIVDSQLSVLSLVIVKKGEQDIPGITDTTRPRRLGPKRANKLRTLFALDKTDDVRKYVIKRKIEKEGKKPSVKAPKIQRLVTPQRLQRKRAEVAGKRNRAIKQRELAADYAVLLAKRAKERTEARKAEHERRRLSSNRASGSSDK
eukprot:m.9380 g.9380  ORF g.9380 m.9380 type:complete len:245 (-) comp6896_c1_seq1:781-1515(-)